MFDDPKKALRRLDEELRAEEAPLEPEEPEDFSLDDVLGCADGDDDLLRDVEALLNEDDTPISRAPLKRRGPRNDAVDFHRTVYAGEEMDESSAVFVEKKKKKKSGKGCGCLPVILLLELAGIAGLVWWWLRWLS